MHYGPSWAWDFNRPEAIEARRQIADFRRRTVLGAALLFAAPAMAQDAPKTFTLTVTSQDLNVLSAALDELPRKVSEPIVQKLQKQLIPQMQPHGITGAEQTAPEVTCDSDGKNCRDSKEKK